MSVKGAPKVFGGNKYIYQVHLNLISFQNGETLPDVEIHSQG